MTRLLSHFVIGSSVLDIGYSIRFPEKYLIAAIPIPRVFLLCLLMLGVASCSRPVQPISRTWMVMGTYASLTVSAEDAAALADRAELVRADLEDMDNRLSIFKPDSEISTLNRCAGVSPVQLSDLTAEALRLSLQYADATGGAFDPTVAPLMRFWGFNKGPAMSAVPERTAISSVMEMVGFHHLSLSNRTAFLDQAGMSVDLGGIGKGYAVDVCYQDLVKKGLKNMMVNLGGNIRCRGSAGPGQPWSIGVRDPFNPDRIVGTLHLADGMAVATSGNYEKFVEIEGKRYSHIMDPRTGRPVEGVASVTVIATNAVEADAMSTAIFVMGLKESQPVLRRLPGCCIIFIPDERPTRVYVSSGVRDCFTADPAFAGQILDIAPDK